MPNKTISEVHQYWKNVPDQINSPETYLQGKENSKFLVEIVQKYDDSKNQKILELGCNVGRNLNELFESGFKNLEGVEINEKAVKLMKVHYPEMANASKIIVGEIENWIKEIPDNYYDIVFSMAVLMHIHSESEWIFKEIARITKKTLITIEDEQGVATKNFCRNYKTVFEKLGMKQVEGKNCKNIGLFDERHFARIFAKQ